MSQAEVINWALSGRVAIIPVDLPTQRCELHLQTLAGGEKLIVSFGSATSLADMPFHRQITNKTEADNVECVVG